MGSIRHPNLWPPFTQMASAANSQRVVSGDGALLIREQGEPLIDAISSWWVTLHGHAHPVLAKAIADQAESFGPACQGRLDRWSQGLERLADDGKRLVREKEQEVTELLHHAETYWELARSHRRDTFD